MINYIYNKLKNNGYLYSIFLVFDRDLYKLLTSELNN